MSATPRINLLDSHRQANCAASLGKGADCKCMAAKGRQGLPACEAGCWHPSTFQTACLPLQARISSAQQYQHQQQAVHEYADPGLDEPLAQASPRDASPHHPQRQSFDGQLVPPGAATSPPAARHSAMLADQAAAAACGLPAAEGSAPMGVAAAAHFGPASGRAAQQLAAASQPRAGPYPEQQPALESLEAPNLQSDATLRPTSATWHDSSSATGPVGDTQPVNSD